MISERTETLSNGESSISVSGNGRATTRWLSIANASNPLLLKSGESLLEASLSYETYGRLNRRRDNAILLFHALTGSQHAAGYNPAVGGVGDLWTKDCQTGWWDRFIGPGKALDTDQHFVICANYLIDASVAEPHRHLVVPLPYDDTTRSDVGGARKMIQEGPTVTRTPLPDHLPTLAVGGQDVPIESNSLE